MDSETLAAYFGSRTRRELVARDEDHHAYDQLGHGVRILSGRVHHDDAPLGAGRQIDVVVAGSGPHDDFQVPGRIDHLARDLIAADDQSVGIGHGGQQFRLIGVLFEQSQLVSGSLDDFSYTVDRRLGKRFLGSYQYFHKRNVL